MSRAFTREQDSGNSISDIGERPVSEQRNLVTKDGLEMIEAEIARLRTGLAEAEGDADREQIAIVSRDLRYWNARRENAEVSVPEPDSTVLRFGMTVSLEGSDGSVHTWKIVGEDEADASKGKISHVAPMALALFGKTKGDVVTVNGKNWEITGLSADG